jgi:cytochrome P450
MPKDLFSSAEAMECPYSFYKTLRDEQPIFFSESLGAYIVTRFADIQTISNDQTLFSSMPGASSEFGDLNYSPFYDFVYEEEGVPNQVPTLVRTGGAQHRRYRNLVDRYFSPRAIKEMEPQLTAIIDQLIDEFIDAGEVDLQKDFCLKLPLKVMCSLLGLPPEDAAILAASADAQTRLNSGAMETKETRLELHRTQASFHRYILEHVEKRRQFPDASILSDLIHTLPDEVEPLSEGELCSLISLMNIGGNETTTSGLSNMFYLLISHPEIEQRLRDNRKLIQKFVEEALRLESPVVVMFRCATRDVEVSGVNLPKDSLILLNYASANRDERQFLCPEKLDIERKGIRNHVAFGSGVHYCLGAALARSELEIAMNRVLDRMTNIRIDDGTAPLKHQPKVGVRTLEALPIRFDKFV